MNLNKMTIEDVQVSGKKVLVRCDFNVPLDAEGNITDETRINAALPTIRYLLDNGAAVILCSHLGRPKGEYNMKYSLAPVAKRLSEKLGFEVKLAKDVVGPDAKKLAAEVEPGKAVLLENVRFDAGRGEERSRAGQGACLDGRAVCVRRVRHRPSRACLDRGRRELPARRCRLPDRQGASVPGQRRRASGAPVPRHSGRREGQGQDRRHHRRCSKRSTCC